MMGLLAYDAFESFSQHQLERSFLASLLAESTRISHFCSPLGGGGLCLSRSGFSALTLTRGDFEDPSAFDLGFLILSLPWDGDSEYCTRPQESSEMLIRAFFETSHRMSVLVSMLDQLQAAPSYFRFYFEEIHRRSLGRRNQVFERFSEGLDGLLKTRG